MMMKNKKELRYERSDKSADTYSIQIPRIDNRYIDWFITRHCAPWLLEHRIFPDTKELSETIGAYKAATGKLLIRPKEEKTLCICTGDGVKARTGLFLSLTTFWEIYSVDPKLEESLQNGDFKKMLKPVKRLTLFPNRVEDCTFNIADKEFNTILVIAVHSHAKLSDTLKAIKFHSDQKIHIISIPCCVQDDLEVAPWGTYMDGAIHSPQRTVNIYREVT